MLLMILVLLYISMKLPYELNFRVRNMALVLIVINSLYIM
jgi:hypothetical protein